MPEEIKPKLIDTCAPRKKFGFLKTLDIYVLKEFLFIFFCCTFAFIAMWLISDIMNSLGDFTSNKSGFIVTTSYFLYKIPSNIVFILPLSLLLSCIYTMAKLGMNNEITALRSSGISLIRCGLSIYIVGFLVTCFHFWCNESLSSECEIRAQAIKSFQSDPNFLENRTKMLIYPSPNGERTWLIKYPSYKEQIDVQIKKYDKEGEVEFKLEAKKAIYHGIGDWDFYDVKLIKYKRIKLTEDFDTDNLGKTQEILIPQTQHFPEFTKKNKEYADLGILTETPKDILNMIKQPDELSSMNIITLLKNTVGMPPETINLYKTILYYNLSYPWICLFCVFLGVPLAARNERAGVMVAVLSAVGVVIFYLILNMIFLVLGKRNFIPAFVAGAGPTLVLAGYVWYKVFKHQ